MRIRIQSRGSFNNSKAWLSDVINRTDSSFLRTVASDGEKSLSNNTPRDTGETASGWTSDIETTRRGNRITWYNVAHPHTSVNIAKIIELGHGTGTGGYVPPNPYIKKSMDSVWDRASSLIEKELLK